MVCVSVCCSVNNPVKAKKRFYIQLCLSGPVSSACWIQTVGFVIVKTAPGCTMPPVFLSVKCPRITPPGEGQTLIICVTESE